MSSSKLSFEIKKISDQISCGKSSYEYSGSPVTQSQTGDGFPFIDQVIYREWNEDIVFKQTSTVFQRVEGRIKWYKSKVNENQGNPIFINGELNENFWEAINDCCDYVVFRQEFTYNGGSQIFTLDYTPNTIILVSINGYGPMRSTDYFLQGNNVTILPPNDLEEGSEIVIVAAYGGDQFINIPGGFNTILDENGDEQFNASNSQSIAFEGQGGTQIDFQGNKVIVKGNYVGNYEDIGALNAADVGGEGNVATTGTGVNFKVYNWDAIAETWVLQSFKIFEEQFQFDADVLKLVNDEEPTENSNAVVLSKDLFQAFNQKVDTSSLSSVAFSGDYNDLANAPEPVFDLDFNWEFDGNKVYTFPSEIKLVRINFVVLYGYFLPKDNIAYTIDTDMNTLTLGEVWNPSVADKIQISARFINV
jgi:hypothetical protein